MTRRLSTIRFHIGYNYNWLSSLLQYKFTKLFRNYLYFHNFLLNFNSNNYTEKKKKRNTFTNSIIFICRKNIKTYTFKFLKLKKLKKNRRKNFKNLFLHKDLIEAYRLIEFTTPLLFHRSWPLQNKLKVIYTNWINEKKIKKNNNDLNKENKLMLENPYLTFNWLKLNLKNNIFFHQGVFFYKLKSTIPFYSFYFGMQNLLGYFLRLRVYETFLYFYRYRNLNFFTFINDSYCFNYLGTKKLMEKKARLKKLIKNKLQINNLTFKKLKIDKATIKKFDIKKISINNLIIKKFKKFKTIQNKLSGKKDVINVFFKIISNKNFFMKKRKVKLNSGFFPNIFISNKNNFFLIQNFYYLPSYFLKVFCFKDFEFPLWFYRGKKKSLYINMASNFFYRKFFFFFSITRKLKNIYLKRNLEIMFRDQNKTNSFIFLKNYNLLFSLPEMSLFWVLFKQESNFLEHWNRLIKNKEFFFLCLTSFIYKKPELLVNYIMSIVGGSRKFRFDLLPLMFTIERFIWWWIRKASRLIPGDAFLKKNNFFFLKLSRNILLQSFNILNITIGIKGCWSKIRPKTSEYWLSMGQAQNYTIKEVKVSYFQTAKVYKRSTLGVRMWITYL